MSKRILTNENKKEQPFTAKEYKRTQRGAKEIVRYIADH
jgi:hypothetical protein